MATYQTFSRFPQRQWPRVVCATAAAFALCYPMGILAELVWTHLFAAFAALVLLALVTLQLHPRSHRVAGVPVRQDCVTAS